VFSGGPGNYQKTLALAIKPPWYFDPGLMGFDSVTLTLTLSTTCYQCYQYGQVPITLAGATGGTEVMQLGAVSMQEGDNGAVVLCPITFVITTATSRGFYMLFLNAQANAADGTTFVGWTQIPVSILYM
jgi:hypothetical protein